MFNDVDNYIFFSKMLLLFNATERHFPVQGGKKQEQSAKRELIYVTIYIYYFTFRILPLLLDVGSEMVIV